MLFGLFKSKKEEVEEVYAPIRVDIHSHLLPGIDDGAETMEQSLEMLKGFQQAGFRKMYTTPHIIRGTYDNTPEIIRQKTREVNEAAVETGLTIKVEAAAEYFFDEHFVSDVQQNQELLTFGMNKYLLFETGFAFEPMQMRNIILALQKKEIFPVLAHPDRYQYLQDDWAKVKKVYETGVLFQVNVLSLVGHYGKPHQQLAEKLIDNDMVHFLGSDCHRLKNQEQYLQAMETKHYKKALEADLHNHYL
jgi:protein-tyrosine phosphatase